MSFQRRAPIRPASGSMGLLGLSRNAVKLWVMLCGRRRYALGNSALAAKGTFSRLETGLDWRWRVSLCPRSSLARS